MAPLLYPVEQFVLAIERHGLQLSRSSGCLRRRPGQRRRGRGRCHGAAAAGTAVDGMGAVATLAEDSATGAGTGGRSMARPPRASVLWPDWPRAPQPVLGPGRSMAKAAEGRRDGSGRDRRRLGLRSGRGGLRTLQREAAHTDNGDEGSWFYHRDLLLPSVIGSQSHLLSPLHPTPK